MQTHAFGREVTPFFALGQQSNVEAEICKVALQSDFRRNGALILQTCDAVPCRKTHVAPMVRLARQQQKTTIVARMARSRTGMEQGKGTDFNKMSSACPILKLRRIHLKFVSQDCLKPFEVTLVV